MIGGSSYRSGGRRCRSGARTPVLLLRRGRERCSGYWSIKAAGQSTRSEPQRGKIITVMAARAPHGITPKMREWISRNLVTIVLVAVLVLMVLMFAQLEVPPPR